MNNRRQIISIFPILLMVLLAACAPAAPAPGTQAPAKPGWEAKWEEVVSGAKQEGKLVLYTTLGANQRQILVSPFESEYGVTVEAVTGAVAAELMEKLASQQRAGLYQVDVWHSGAPTVVDLKTKRLVDPLEPALILPELTDPQLIKKTWYYGELPWVDKDRTMLFSALDIPDPVVVNTNLVKPGEITAYRDLLNPKWREKISIQDPTISGGGSRWFSVVLETGDVDINYMRDLLRNQQLMITRERRLQLEWLAHGKHAIAIAPQSAAVTEFIGIGAPVKRYSVGTRYVTGGTSAISLVKRAPNSNAAKLFINWFHTKEGETALSKALGAQSQRLDVPTGHLEPGKVLTPGSKVFNTNTEEFITKSEGLYIALAKETFGPYMK